MRTLPLLLALAAPAGAHASECISNADFEAAQTKVATENAARRARALESAKLERLERTPVSIDLSKGLPTVGTIIEQRGRRLVVVRAEATLGLRPKLLPMILAKDTEGNVGRLVEAPTAGKHRTVTICGKRPCRPGKGTRAGTSSLLAGLPLDVGERWSPQRRTVRFRRDSVVGSYSRTENCPPVP